MVVIRVIFIAISSLDYIELDEIYYIDESKSRAAYPRDDDFINSIFNNSDFIKNVGILAYEDLIENSFMIGFYALHDGSIVIGEYMKNIKQKHSSIIYNLLLSLWIVKDNSVNTDELYIYQRETSLLHINSHGVSYSMANGEYKSIKFTKEEIQQTKEWLRIIQPHLNIKGKESNLSVRNNRTYIPYNHFGRIAKSLLFVINARTDSFLPSKIAHYITSLEALVSSEDNNLKKQVSERSANLIGETAKQKAEINNNIRKAYKTRSSYVHGDNIRQRDLQEISIEMDIIVREAVRKFILNYSHVDKLDRKKFSKWFHQNIK